MTGATRLTFGDLGVGSAVAVAYAVAAWWLLASGAPDPPPHTVAVVASIAPARGGGTPTSGPVSRPRSTSRSEPATDPTATASPPTPSRHPAKRGRPSASTAEAPTPTEAGGGGGGGEGDGGTATGSGEGGGEPSLDAESIAAYRAELLGWLSGRFVVERSGLEADVLATLKVRASVVVADDGTVSGFSIDTPSGYEVVDEAVRDALEPLVGRALPVPPVGYPGGLPPKLTVTFVCTKSRCS